MQVYQVICVAWVHQSTHQHRKTTTQSENIKLGIYQQSTLGIFWINMTLEVTKEIEGKNKKTSKTSFNNDQQGKTVLSKTGLN